METTIYTSPRLVMMPHNWANWNKRVSIVPSKLIDFPWGKMQQTTRINKSIMVKADIEKAWKVVSNPSNIPLYVDSVIKITENKEGFNMDVTYLSEEKKSWAKDTLKATIVEKKPPNSFSFTFELPEKHKETIGYLMEENPKGTLLTQYFEVDGKLTNPEDDEIRMEMALKKLVELIMGSGPFKTMMEESLT